MNEFITQTVDKNPEHTYALVSTVRFLLLVNLTTKMVIPLEFNRPEYYGISWFPNEKELILSHSQIENGSLVEISDYALSEVGVISRGEVITHPFLSQPHQIFCASDGRVICSNTGRNSISVIDLAKPNYLQETRISSARWDRLSKDNKSGDHLNSVFEKDGLLYVIAHGFDKGSVLATLSYPDLEIQTLEPIKKHTGLHNIWVTKDGQRISCATEQGGLIEIGDKSFSTLWTSGSNIFTRGLAASSEFILVGETQLSQRGMRPYLDSGLWMVDRKTYQVLDYFYLGPFGGVHEVRLLNVPDEAHHGFIFNGLNNLLENDSMKSFVDEKINNSFLQGKRNKWWASFSAIIGVPTVNPDISLTAEDDLCLILQRKTLSESKAIYFRYSLHKEKENSHVSTVIYNGHGDDTHMHALLLHSDNKKEAYLSLWFNDGETWSVLSRIKSNLPMSGDIEVFLHSTNFKVYINNKLVSAIPSENLLLKPETAFGIRWIGSTVSLNEKTSSKMEKLQKKISECFS